MHYVFFIFVLGIVIIAGTVFRQINMRYSLPVRTIGKEAVLYSVFLFLGLVAILRGPVVGNDTETYIDLFRSIAQSNDLSVFLLRYEIGYVWFNKICSKVSENPQTIIIISGIITTVGYLYFFKRYSKAVFLSVVMFVCLRYYDQTLNIIRECIAICILLYSYKYIANHNFIKFCLCVILAFVFHKTAIIFLIAWWIVKLEFKMRNLLLISSLSIVFAIQFGAIFQHLLTVFETYSYYDGGKYFGETRLATILMLVMQVVFLGLAFYIRKKNISHVSADDDRMLMLWSVGICILIVSTQFNLLDRIATYFNVFSLVALPNLISIIGNKNNKLVVSTMLVILLLGYYISILEFKSSWNRIYPYEITPYL